MTKFRNWQGSNGREWYSRGYLPHRDKPGLTQAITFHLGDSLSRKVLEKLNLELSQLKAISGDEDVERIRNIRSHRINLWLDAGHGSCLLQRPDLAECVQETLLNRDGLDYDLIAWCVMPNHVHVVATITAGVALGEVVKGWKSVSSRKVMTKAKLSTGIWGRDYFDRYIRDDDHLKRAIDYAEDNPVKANLARSKEEWQWSSAWKGE